MDRRADRGQTTRRHIVDTATRLFTDHGYEAVSVDTLLAECGISRGALYHHFAGKEAVFTAALESAEERIVANLASRAANARDPVAALRAGCAAWLDLASTDATVRRVVLADAPGVIGWQAWRALDERYTLGLIHAGLTRAIDAGCLRSVDVDVSAHVLLAVLVEVALLIARAPDDAEVARAGRAAVDLHLDGLLKPDLAPNVGVRGKT